MQPVFHGQARGKAGQCRVDLPAGLDRAQARLPSQRKGVIGTGDAIGGQLAVCFQKGRIEGQGDTGARHHLTLECIAVDIDEGRGQDHPGGPDHPSAVAGGVKAGDAARFDAHRDAGDFAGQDDLGAVEHQGLIGMGHASRSAKRCQCQEPGVSWTLSRRESTSNPAKSARRSRALQK